MRKSLWIKIILLIFVLSSIPAYFQMKQAVYSEKAFHNSTLSPVIFIPGSSASQNRFDDLLKQYNTPKKRHSIVKITVRKNNHLHVTGKITAHDKQPFIVIAFQNNADGYQNIKKQTYWLKLAINYLTANYNFNNFSAVGHSNGGLIWTWYLEKYFNHNALRINHLITIGTPYNSLESNIKNQTAIFHQLHQHRQQLPKNLIVDSIAGTKNYQDDGIVPYQSVEAGKYIFQNTVAKYTQATVTGDDSEHSSLLANQQVRTIIRENILNQFNFNNEKKP